MTGTRLYVPADYAPDSNIDLPDAARDHLRARRLSPGDELTLFDGSGLVARAHLQRLDKRGASATIETVEASHALDSPLNMVLVQGMSKGDAMDLVIQKATELGVARILPVYTDNSVVRLKGDRASRKQGHWHRVAASACEQCGRNTLPRIDAPSSLREASAALPGAQGVVISATAQSGFSSLVLGGEPMALAVGPEGGFSADEIHHLVAVGWHASHLGPRVMRTETAALAALVAFGLRFGDLG